MRKLAVVRLQNVFEGNYRPTALYEKSRKVGSVRAEDNKLYFTFRGSIGSWTELLSCLDVRKFSAEKLGLTGKVHAGLYSNFDKVQQSIDSYVDQFFRKNLKGVSIIVEGYSRGSALAILTAAYLTHQFAADNLTVITYSPMNIFDKAAANAYKQKITNEYNFVCKGDLVSQWIGPSFLGFFPSANKIEFSPKDSPSFLERVRKKAYTHLIRPWLIGRILRFFIPLRLWEIHMPETYYDGSITAFNKAIALHY